MKIAFYTLGCKVNQYDTQMMSEKFIGAGHDIVDFSDVADIYVINTCTVTQMSDKKSRNIISRAKRLNVNAVIVVCGCFSQVSSEEVSLIDGVDIVLGTSNRSDIVYYVNEYLKNGKQIVDVERKNSLSNEYISDFSEKTRAILKIEDGCRNFCSYCLIPFARGKIISKPLQHVVDEATAIANHGYCEIVLTGIHLSSYGIDLDGVGLADAINSVGMIDGIDRIRLGSLEPMIISKEFLEKVKDCEKLCPSFHLSLQSGCDKTLETMNRKYTSDEYRRAVKLLREYYPGCAITTDVIVGFPGESDADFKDSLEFVREMGFAKVHIFPYSKRKGTKAASMPCQIDKKTKQQREKQLCEVEKDCRLTFLESMVGTSQKVLVERCIDGICVGFSKNYITIKFEGDESLVNSIVDVKIVEIIDDCLMAKL